MKSVTLLCALLLTPTLTLAKPCSGEKSDQVVGQAIALVTKNHPVLVAEHEEFIEQTRQKRWDAYVTTGYSVTDTFESGESGPNAALRVKIPLFDRTHQLKLSSARTTWQRVVSAITKEFLAGIEQLCAQAARYHELNTMHRFYRDRLSYRQQRVDEGLDEADSLWQETEKVQQAGHDWRRESVKLSMMRLSMAREYGGSQWKPLRDLLAGITN